MRRRNASSRGDYIRTPWFRKLKSSFHVHKRLAYVLTFLILSFLILFLSLGEHTLAQKTRTSLLQLATPLIKVSKVPVDFMEAARQGCSNLIHQKEQIVHLRNENEKLRTQILLARQIQKENLELRRAFKITQNKYKVVAHARVLSYPGTPYSKSILLGIGQNQGLAPLQTVVTPQGLVGRLTEVGPTSARAILLTDLTTHIPVIIKPGNVHGILTGTNSPIPKLKYIQHTGKIQPGDLVETSASEGIFPMGLEVGRIDQIDGDHITVKPMVDTDNLSFVTIVKPTEITGPLGSEA